MNDSVNLTPDHAGAGSPRPDAAQLACIAQAVRTFCFAANKHPGGSLSSADLTTALFFGSRAEFASRSGEQPDRFVLSKGHAASPYFFALWALGYLPEIGLDQLVGYGDAGHSLSRMPRRDLRRGIEMSTGSLGQGLSFGAGLALADRKAGRTNVTHVLLGDGECTEGQVWEAAMTAPRLGLRNLTAILDANGSGSVIKLPREEWAGRWRGFGWEVFPVDGHDLGALHDAFDAARDADGPAIVIAHTVKGIGLHERVVGSNMLSSAVAAADLPEYDLEGAVSQALPIIHEYFAPTAAVAAAPLARPGRRELTEAMDGLPVGEPAIAKQVGGALSIELAERAGMETLFASPDAIRNSGILPRMEKVGTWTWQNPGSNVLQLGIAEQDGASLMAGAAAGGLYTLLFSMEGFYWRMLDQIRESICFCDVPVVLVGTSGGIGDLLGPMVQSDTVLSALSTLIGLTVFEAGDANTAKALVAEAIASGRPAYVRLPHEATPQHATLAEVAGRRFDEGYWLRREHAEADVVLFTAGGMATVSDEVAGILAEHGKSCAIVEVFSPTRFTELAPSKRAALVPAGARTALLHNAPSEVLGRFLGADALRFGADGWGDYGPDLPELYRAAGLDASAVAARILAALDGRAAEER